MKELYPKAGEGDPRLVIAKCDYKCKGPCSPVTRATYAETPLRWSAICLMVLELVNRGLPPVSSTTR